MRIRLIISLLVTLGILSCASKSFHSVTIFAIEGRVYDRESNFPLNRVKVSFIDTGYDEVRSKKAAPVDIGWSDSRGKIEVRLNYLWGGNKSIFNSAHAKTFDIVLSREAYETIRLSFKESDLQTDGLTFLVNLKAVYLMRAKDAR